MSKLLHPTRHRRGCNDYGITLFVFLFLNALIFLVLHDVLYDTSITFYGCLPATKSLQPITLIQGNEGAAIMNVKLFL